jgi:hypothetical protein
MGLLRDTFFGGGRSAGLLPANAPALLESFGRGEGPAPGRGDARAAIELFEIIKKALDTDQERTLDELVAACDAVGGWSYYGAWELLHSFAPEREEDPRYVHIVDGLLDTLEADGFGPGDVPMALTERAVARQRAGRAAQPPVSGPPEPEPGIAPVAEGEQRLLEVVDRPDGNQNRIYLIRRPTTDSEPYPFVAVIQGSDDPDFDFETAWGWQRGADERTVYIRVAEAYANSRTAACGYWLDPDVQWFADRVG